MLDALTSEFHRYRRTGELALAQVSEAGLNRIPFADGNSIGMLVRHISGNFRSRFTDFLTSDGEKPWRHRDDEFEEHFYSRTEIETMWVQGWDTLEAALGDLSADDLTRTVRIRGGDLTVAAALARSLAHVAYHVGQIIWLARLDRQDGWEWISIPKGESEAYNASPFGERSPDGSE